MLDRGLLSTELGSFGRRFYTEVFAIKYKHTLDLQCVFIIHKTDDTKWLRIFQAAAAVSSTAARAAGTVSAPCTTAAPCALGRLSDRFKASTVWKACLIVFAT